MQSHIFLFETEQYSTKPEPILTVSERLARFGADAFTVPEHLSLLVGSEPIATDLLKHFGSLLALSRASVRDLSPFLSHSLMNFCILTLRWTIRFGSMTTIHKYLGLSRETSCSLLR
jgi:DNA repair protein RadC